MFIGCAFVSILVHEYGHGLTAQSFGYRASEVVLYGMGGYCACEFERQSPWQRVAVLFAGPGAGFLFLGVVLVVGRAFLGIPFSDDLTLMGRMLGIGGGRLSPAFGRLSDTLRLVYYMLIVINLMWGIFNLFPIWPLDGGRLTEVFLTMYNRRQGARWAHIVSIVTAGILAVFSFQRDQIPAGIFFVYFAFTNYQVLQALRQTTRYGYAEDDADWWKR
jgi:membrane-associated protease RseP (regulator of RpoE activity)